MQPLPDLLRRLHAEDLALLLGMQQKDLRKLCGRLREDRLIAVYETVFYGHSHDLSCRANPWQKKTAILAQRSAMGRRAL